MFASSKHEAAPQAAPSGNLLSRVMRIEEQCSAMQSGYASLEEDSRLRIEVLEVRDLLKRSVYLATPMQPHYPAHRCNTIIGDRRQCDVNVRRQRQRRSAQSSCTRAPQRRR